jgi:hypothetical protein
LTVFTTSLLKSTFLAKNTTTGTSRNFTSNFFGMKDAILTTVYCESVRGCQLLVAALQDINCRGSTNSDLNSEQEKSSKSLVTYPAQAS